ncbi:MAG: hypothetical protein IJ846_02570 [Alphaproteobacteria bacterium]|nr:hypothetical protein [Alphaproteobacteria bacterium]
MKKRISITASIAFAALFSFAGTAGAVVNDGNSNLQHYQNAYQMEAYEGGGGGGGYVPNTTTTCGPGQYRSGSSCLSCGPGTYKTGTNTHTSCTSCPAGTYTSSYAAVSCSSCPAGKYASGTGNTSCTACAAGKFSAAGASTCTACGAGTYASGTGNASCTTCPAGTYAGNGASSCTSCPSGTTSPAGSYASSACVTVAATNTVSGNCPSGMKKSSDGNSCVIDVVTSMNVSAACYNYALSATASGVPRDGDLAYY